MEIYRDNGRAKIIRDFNGLTIDIPSKKVWWWLIFALIWLVGWYFGMQSAIHEIQSNKAVDLGAKFFLMAWLVIWIAGGLFIIFLILWGFFGREKFIEEGNRILLQKSILGIGKKYVLDKKAIKHFRRARLDHGRFGVALSSDLGLGGGKIKFDYGLRTFSFGKALDDAEADFIIDLLQKKFNNKSF